MTMANSLPGRSGLSCEDVVSIQDRSGRLSLRSTSVLRAAREARCTRLCSSRLGAALPGDSACRPATTRRARSRAARTRPRTHRRWTRARAPHASKLPGRRELHDPWARLARDPRSPRWRATPSVTPLRCGETRAVRSPLRGGCVSARRRGARDLPRRGRTWTGWRARRRGTSSKG